MSERTNDEYDTTRRGRVTNPDENGKWVSGLIALLGLWLVAAALVFEMVEANFWNHVLVGALLAAVGGYNYVRRSDRRMGNKAAAAFAALLGLWLIVSPFVVDTEIAGTDVEAVTEVGFWNPIIVGGIVFLLGAYSAYEAREIRSARTTGTRTR